MSHQDHQLRSVSDPRLALHATSARPAWLFAPDGSRVLWANPVGARAFGAASGAKLSLRTFGPADERRRQIAQLAGRLPESGAARLERLRGFGAALGGRATCSCARLAFDDGSHGILVAPLERGGRTMPLTERLQRLVEGVDGPVAAFGRDGSFIGASEAARSLFGFRDLRAAGLEAARKDALASGRAEAPLGSGHLVLQRVGAGADIGLVAFIASAATPDGAAADTAPAAAQATSFFPMPATEEVLVTPPEQPAPETSAPAAALPEVSSDAAQEAEAPSRRHPLRFAWNLDRDGLFSLAADEFARLIGPQAASSLPRSWQDLAQAFALDPDGRVARAIATRDTWSGITLDWPLGGGAQVAVELSGLPTYDEAQNFAGYRGFGVCRDPEALAQLAALRDAEIVDDEPVPPQHSTAALSPHPERGLATDQPDRAPRPPEIAGSQAPIDMTPPEPTSPEPAVETARNVVPFRPPGEAKQPVLTPVENNAFDELARQLSERLENGNGHGEAHRPGPEPTATELPPTEPPLSEPPRPQPEWLGEPEPPARGVSERDRTLLDLLPTGVLIYRLDRLLYANPAFLRQMGYESLHALEQAGGVDALYVEAGSANGSSTSEAGTPVTISVVEENGDVTSSIEARLYTISWDGESALALMFSPMQSQPVAPVVAAPATPPSAVGHANAEELGAILDTTAEGIVMFDAGGNMHACNRSAEALFGYDGADLVRRNLTELFAPESRREVLDYLESIKGFGVESLLEHGREVLGRVNKGGLIPLSMTMGRTRPDGPNFFAVFRDVTQNRKVESEVQQARRLTETAANAKADLLARISHEMRAPMNAIIGFAEVMISERFGALGNDRYVEYMKDIRSSGSRVIAMVDDLLELSRIETGKLELAFANQNINELVESCVAAMQREANRERIIIRTSLAPALPPVVADARALRQIALNLIGNSIRLANSGGQVIVSTALTDFGEVVLRVRDTGHGLNQGEVTAALEPFRNGAPSEQASSSAVNLSLTKALVEANRAQFHIRTAPQSGTLIEVVFPHALARA